jgi:sulfur-carrier protein
MQINIITFGQICEVLGETVVVNNINDTDSLILELKNKYPRLKDITYRIAVNKKLISTNTLLTDNSTVALMPAFSGG